MVWLTPFATDLCDRRFLSGAVVEASTPLPGLGAPPRVIAPSAATGAGRHPRRGIDGRLDGGVWSQELQGEAGERLQGVIHYGKKTVT